MARSEFRKGDVLVQIGEPFKWLILGVERTGQMWMYKTISEIGLREEIDGMYEWTDENSDNMLLADFEFVKDLRDYVKVGEWDFEKNQEVDEDEV